MIAIFNFPKLIEQRSEQISGINHVCCHNEDLFFLIMYTQGWLPTPNPPVNSPLKDYLPKQAKNIDFQKFHTRCTP